MSLKSFAGWVCFAAVLWFIGGPVGVLVAVAVGWYLLLRLDGRILVGIGAALFVGVPFMMLLNGLTDEADLQPQIVGTYATSNNLAFAGLVCLAVGVAVSVRAQTRPGEEDRNEQARAAMSEDVTNAMVDESAMTMSIAQVDDIDLYLTMSEQEESGQVTPEHTSRRSLLTGAGWMAVFIVTQSVTGIGFWFLSSRFYPTEAVGLASALFSLLLLVTFVTGMGLPVTIPLFAGGSEREDTTILTYALIYTTVTSAVGTVVFLLLVQSDATTLLREEGGALGWLIFFVSVAGASVASLVDVRLMGARRWSLVFYRSLLVGLGRIALLFVPKVGNGALWLFSVGALPVAVSGLFAVAILPGAAKIRYHLRPWPQRTFSAFRFASINFLATLSSQAPTFILPVIVLANVDPTANAQYFLAWSAASVAFLFPTTIAQVLLVESSGTKVVDPVQARLRYLEALGLSLGIVIIGTVATIALKGVVQSLFGPAYAGTSALLPLLVGASIPWAFTAISLTRARLRKDSRAIIATTLTLGVVTIGVALELVPREGTVGAAVAWVVGQTITAIVALVMDRMWTVYPPKKRSSVLGAAAAQDHAAILDATGGADDADAPDPAPDAAPDPVPELVPATAGTVAAGAATAHAGARAVEALPPPPAPRRSAQAAQAAPAASPPAPSLPPPPAAPAPAAAPLPAPPPRGRDLPPPPARPARGGRRGRSDPAAPSRPAPKATPPRPRDEEQFSSLFDEPKPTTAHADPAFEQGLDRDALQEALFGSSRKAEGPDGQPDDPTAPEAGGPA